MTTNTDVEMRDASLAGVGNGAQGQQSGGNGTNRLFTLKKLNVVALWSWDVESENCAICRSQVMGTLVFLIFYYLHTFLVRQTPALYITYDLPL